MSPLGDYDGHDPRPSGGSLLHDVVIFLVVFAVLFIVLTVVAIAFDT